MHLYWVSVEGCTAAVAHVQPKRDVSLNQWGNSLWIRQRPPRTRKKTGETQEKQCFFFVLYISIVLLHLFLYSFILTKPCIWSHLLRVCRPKTLPKKIYTILWWCSPEKKKLTIYIKVKPFLHIKSYYNISHLHTEVKSG